MNYPQFEATSESEGFANITFDPPVTRGELGLPFSYLVQQRKESQVLITRFGRIFEVTCLASHWVAYLTTHGYPPEVLDDFKEAVGYVEPEPEVAAAESEATEEVPAKA
ncbi:hypothetical protein L6Q85_04440 [bacterium]|nr:hypothetical protein [bacterium]NUP91837.1 hypothetical protein [Candidatus Omnitrophota bacterium]